MARHLFFAITLIGIGVLLNSPAEAVTDAPRCEDQAAFFFRAEDGIRGGRVTGVQTCARPISPLAASASQRGPLNASWNARYASFAWARSEERRVGQECRSRWSTYH